MQTAQYAANGSVGMGKRPGALQAAPIVLMKLSMPAEPRFVAFARRSVQAVGRQLRMDDLTLSDIVLAVGEACNNGVLHGELDSGRVLSITCRVSQTAARKDGVLEVEIRNHGRGFGGNIDANRFQMPRAESLTDHGRGLPLMKTLVDDVEFVADGPDTIVRLVKQLG